MIHLVGIGDAVAGQPLLEILRCVETNETLNKGFNYVFQDEEDG